MYIGDKECQNIEKGFSQIICRTPASDQPGSRSINIIDTGYSEIYQQIGHKIGFAFNYSAKYTPIITALSQSWISTPNPLLNVTIRNLVFNVPGSSSIAELTSVTNRLNIQIGLNSECDIQFSEFMDANNSFPAEIVVGCRVKSLPVGNYDVSVYVNNTGLCASDINNRIRMARNVISFLPDTGSIFGGNKLRIIGHGFFDNSENNRVTIDGLLCEIKSSSYTEMVCIVPPLSPGKESLKDAKVVVTSNRLDYQHSRKYSYTLESTPLIVSVTPIQGREGDRMILKGKFSSTSNKTAYTVYFSSDYSSAEEPSTVFLKKIACDVTNVTSNELECVLRDSSAGQFNISAFVDGYGYSNSNQTFTYALHINPPVLQSQPLFKSGFGGGVKVNFTGSGFSNQTKIEICGLPCEHVIAVSSSIECVSSLYKAYMNVGNEVFDSHIDVFNFSHSNLD